MTERPEVVIREALNDRSWLFAYGSAGVLIDRANAALDQLLSELRHFKSEVDGDDELRESGEATERGVELDVVPLSAARMASVDTESTHGSDDPGVRSLLVEIEARIGPGPFQVWGGWNHMGAVVCDAGLQAGMRYESVIRPRIEHLIAAWPDPTLSAFEAEMTDRAALEGVLNFHGPKLDTIRSLSSHLRAEQIDTVQEFATWLDLPSNAASLFEIKGIKDKTADYLRLLVGLPGAAVDRHLRRFVQRAWPEAATYAEVHDLVVRAADASGHDLGGLEYAIWNYESRQLGVSAAQQTARHVEDDSEAGGRRSASSPG